MDLQKEQGTLGMTGRFKARNKLSFDHDRNLKFAKRSIRDLANREFSFEAWRRLHYDIKVEGASRMIEQAKQLNIQGVNLYKEGQLQEAKWCFAKALSFYPSYENAKTNLKTIDKKLKARKKKKRARAKKGQKLSQITKDLKAEARTQGQQEYVHEVQPEYYDTRQPQRQSVPQPWQRNYRCPGCSNPVRNNWLICTNCGTDLRRYPPIPY